MIVSFITLNSMCRELTGHSCFKSAGKLELGAGSMAWDTNSGDGILDV